MPRTARKKHPGAIFHIMMRSISELSLFRDHKDKDRYLQIIKKYQDIYLFDVYAYCLMTTHVHLLIDCCGSDISKIMKSINQSYAMYYNLKYQRHGHVFQDRFKSKIVDNDNYLINLSLYIHNNPKDIKNYKKDVSKYTYSSLGLYLGLRIDAFGIINTSVILQHFSNDIIKARKTYLQILKSNNKDNSNIDFAKEVEFALKESEYRSERKFFLREASPESIQKFIISFTGHNFNPLIKYNHKNNELKSLFIVFMRCLCNFSLKDICTMLGNITLSNAWRLSEKGFDLICTNSAYKNIIDLFISEKMST